MGKWQLRALIGRGGNANVWRAEGHGTIAAIKIPFQQIKGKEPYERFCQEVELLRRLDGHDGVLRVLDANVDLALGEAFHATPIAITMAAWLEGGPSLDDVVGAVHEVARTLCDLGARGIHHRDLKPTNIFKVEGRWVLGDFGLATFPEKEALTEEHTKLGPVYYLAPEMLSDATRANAERADVYSLAKTLWVACTGQRYPVPGEHMLDHRAFRVGTYVVHTKTHSLDRVIARATAHEPMRRQTMAEFAAELRAWLDVVVPVGEDGLDTAGLRDQFHALAASVAERRTANEQLLSELDTEAAALASWLDPLAQLFEKTLPYEIKRGHGRGNDHRPSSADLYHDHAVYFSVSTSTKSSIAVQVHLRVQSTWSGRQELTLSGFLEAGEKRLALPDVRSEFPTGSPLADQVRTEFGKRVTELAKQLLADLAHHLETSEREGLA